MATTSTTDRLVIAGPSSLLQPTSSSVVPSPKQFLLLPHPRTGLPAYFLPSTSSPASLSSPTVEEYDEIYELQSAKSERKARSWFLGGSREEGEAAGQRGGEVEGESAEARGLAGDKGWVIQDPSLHLLSRVDPTFLLLPMLDVLLPPPTPKTSSSAQCASSSSRLLAESGSYLPREDLFESVAGAMHRRLLQAHSQQAVKGAAATLPPADKEGGWVDIPAFGQLALARQALGRLCSTQEMGGGGGGGAGAGAAKGEGEQYFRPSPARIISFLRSKVVALSSAEVFRSHPATLGRMLDRAVDDPLMAIKRANGSLPVKGEGEGDGAGEGEGEEDVKTRKVRTEVALELVRAYVPLGGRVEELFESVVSAGLMRELDEEERKREDHEGRQVGDGAEDGDGDADADADAEAEAALREQEATSGRL